MNRFHHPPKLSALAKQLLKPKGVSDKNTFELTPTNAPILGLFYCKSTKLTNEQFKLKHKQSFWSYFFVNAFKKFESNFFFSEKKKLGLFFGPSRPPVNDLASLNDDTHDQLLKKKIEQLFSKSIGTKTSLLNTGIPPQLKLKKKFVHIKSGKTQKKRKKKFKRFRKKKFFSGFYWSTLWRKPKLAPRVKRWLYWHSMEFFQKLTSSLTHHGQKKKAFKNVRLAVAKFKHKARLTYKWPLLTWVVVRRLRSSMIYLRKFSRRRRRYWIGQPIFPSRRCSYAARLIKSAVSKRKEKTLINKLTAEMFGIVLRSGAMTKTLTRQFKKITIANSKMHLPFLRRGEKKKPRY